MLSSLRSNQFFKNNAIFFVGSLIVSFINYIYYPVVGKLLPVESFGEVQVLISFYIQLTVFLTVLGLVATNVVVNENDDSKSNEIIAELEKAALYFALIISIVIVLVSTVLQSMFKFSSYIPFVIIASVFLVSVLLSFRGAFLRAKQDFVAASLQGIVAGVAKIIFSVLLIAIGLKTSGAIAGLLIAQVIALYYASYRARKLGYKSNSKQLGLRERFFTKPDNSILKKYYKYAAFVFSVSILTTLMYSLDVGVVKYFFSAEQAGQYASIATIARIIFFLTGSFAVVVLSSVKRAAAPSVNYMILVKSFAITLLMGGSAAIFFSLFPTFTVHLLFGARYDGMSHLLPPLSLAMLFASLSTLLAYYYIALGKYLVLVWVSTGFVFTITLLTFHHATISQVVYSFLAGSAVITGLLLSWTGYRALPLLRRSR